METEEPSTVSQVRLFNIVCANCGCSWNASRIDCVYEHLRTEASPCHECGAVTLQLLAPGHPLRERDPAKCRPVFRRIPHKVAHSHRPEVEKRRRAG